MGIALTTAGVTLGYAVGETRPTSDYINIPDIKEIPEMNPEPEALDTTTLAETEFKTSTPGLKDLGGALSFTANYTTELEGIWADLLDAAEGGTVWFEVKHPDLSKALYFTGVPSAMGLPAMSVNSVLETNLYITPTNAPAWVDKTA